MFQDPHNSAEFDYTIIILFYRSSETSGECQHCDKVKYKVVQI